MVIKVKAKKRYILFILFFLVLLLATYYFILKDYSFSSLALAFQKCEPVILVLGIVLMGCYVFWAALFLKRMLYHFGKKITLFHAIGYVCTESYFSAITPSSMGGQPVEMYEMSKDGIPYRINSLIILLNTILYKIALLLLALILFPFYDSVLFHTNSLFTLLVILGFVTTLLVVFLFIMMVYSKKLFPKFILKLIHLGSKMHLIKKEEEKTKSFKKALEDYRKCAEITKEKPKILLEGLFYMLMQRISLLSVSYVVYLSFHLEGYSLFSLLAFQVGITLASDFVPFPGGVVVSENLLLKINEAIYGPLYGASSMILLRSISFYLFVLTSALFYSVFHLIKRKRVVDL